MLAQSKQPAGVSALPMSRSARGRSGVTGRGHLVEKAVNRTAVPMQAVLRWPRRGRAGCPAGRTSAVVGPRAGGYRRCPRCQALHGEQRKGVSRAASRTFLLRYSADRCCSAAARLTCRCFPVAGQRPFTTPPGAARSRELATLRRSTARYQRQVSTTLDTCRFD